MKSCTSVNIKYCSFCVASISLAYLLIKTKKIQKVIRHSLKWLYNNNTYVISSDSESRVAVFEIQRKLQKSKTPVLGLDCEWVSTGAKRHPVALLQLATSDGFCSIFRLIALKRVPLHLKELLENKNVIKVGVAVVNDAQYLLADYGVRCEGCLDLRHLASQVGVESQGLGSLGKELLGIELDKDWRIRCSNWESEVLTTRQVEYAAEDACVAVNIFEILNHKEICKRFSFWKRLMWSKGDYWNNSLSLWSKFIGLNYNAHSKTRSNNTLSSQQTKAATPIIKRNYNTLLQRQHYSNIFLLAPDGQVLSTISHSKAAWYLERELVDTVCEDPKTLKLRFEPSGRSSVPDGYCTKAKDNRCVVCASEKDLKRKNIVPVEYRRHFEESIKNHHFHDVLLLCLPCHTTSNMFDLQLRNDLARECDAPLSEGENNKFVVMPDLKALRSAARALYNSGDVLPKERKYQLQTLISEKLGVSTNLLTHQFLENILDIDCHVMSDNYSPHGLKVVQYYKSHGGGIEVLERKWRQHFLDKMFPQYLPQLWSVNYMRE